MDQASVGDSVSSRPDSSQRNQDESGSYAGLEITIFLIVSYFIGNT